MTAIITNKSRIQRGIDFIAKATNVVSPIPDEVLYLAVGGTTPWTTETDPDIPVGTVEEVRTLQFMKRIDGSSAGQAKLVRMGGRFILTLGTGEGAQFTVGEILTGDTSGTAGTVEHIDVDNVTVRVYENVFQSGEGITGGNAGTATIGSIDDTTHSPIIFRNTNWEAVTVADLAPTISAASIGDIWFDTTAYKTKQLEEFTVVAVGDNGSGKAQYQVTETLNYEAGDQFTVDVSGCTDSNYNGTAMTAVCVDANNFYIDAVTYVSNDTGTAKLYNSITDVVPKYVFIKVQLAAGDGPGGTYTVRELGILENPTDSSGDNHTSLVVDAADVAKQGILHYIDYIAPITRNASQTEYISIIIEQ